MRAFVRRCQQAARHPCCRLSRHLFGPPGRRARRYERARSGRPGRGLGAGAGTGSRLSLCPLRRRRAPSAPSGQDSGARGALSLHGSSSLKPWHRRRSPRLQKGDGFVPSTSTGSASTPSDNPLRRLSQLGQSVWLDYMRRSLVTSGELERLIREDGLSGVTSNPTIFEKAVAGTIAQVRWLWQQVGRPNVMIKVPATAEGLAAIEALTAESINVNVTLIFTLELYERVVQAFLRCLERVEHPERVASVASVFVSRVDTAIDRALEAVESPEALALRGTVAISAARRIYRRFRELFDGETFEPLRRRGARLQRLLWASTSTKNPAYSDVLYVEELIGPDTVNTMPPATLAAFRDHGRVRGATIEEKVPEALARLQQLEQLGIALETVGEQLQKEGVEAFAASWKRLLETVAARRDRIL